MSNINVGFSGPIHLIRSLLDHAEKIGLHLVGEASTAITTGTVSHGVGTAPPDDTGPVNANAPAADSAGIPWDERIHSSNKAQNADGTWRKRRGVVAETIAAVEAELKMRGSQQMYMPSTQVTPATNAVPMPDQTAQYIPPAGQSPQYSPVQPQYQPPMQPQYQAAPQQPQYAPAPGAQYQAPQQPPVQPQQPPVQYTFAQFMQQISAQCQKRDANNQPVIFGEYLANVCQRLSQMFQRPLSAITDLAADQNLIDEAVKMINADGRWA